MFATDRVPLAIVVVAQAQELIKNKSKRRKNPFFLPEGNVSLGEVVEVFNRLHVKDGFDGEDSVFLRPNAFPPTYLNPDTLVRKFMYLMEDASHRSWKNGMGEDLVDAGSVFEPILEVIFGESDCSECAADFRLGLLYDFRGLAALYVRTILILVETMYGREGWVEKRKAGYGLFLERATALGGAEPQSLRGQATAERTEARPKLPRSEEVV
jgi:hypothetical protein